MSVQSVYQYIQEGVIKEEVIPFGDERTIYVISETAYEEAAGILKPSESQRPKRFEYYHSSRDIVLFQK
ncbi:DNA-binding protein, partial [Peribacillus frigoritolerans]